MHAYRHVCNVIGERDVRWRGNQAVLEEVDDLRARARVTEGVCDE